MEDRDGIKAFTIPKTYSSTKDVFINEKNDSRNVLDLFKDIQACALEFHFDFRPNQCQSCDFIRNPKLQKSYNERKMQMKKEQDLTERLAFHFLPSRDLALPIATDGLQCKRLSFPIEKYLGNPEEGVHLSRRPDVLLASTGAQGYLKFGLLVCKILLGKGYPTLPSSSNRELSSQLRYDHHFCKAPTEKKSTKDLLGHSLIFCYEHQDLQPAAQPSQILPIAILWYDLKEKFPTVHECQIKKSLQAKSQANGRWDEPHPESNAAKYASQFLSPLSSPSTPNKKLLSTETIPLSPSTSSPTEHSLPAATIPFDSSEKLLDPRLHTAKPTKITCYLDSQAIQHSSPQHKPLKTSLHSVTPPSYTLVPLHFRSASDSPSLLPLFVPVTDCLSFGLRKSSNHASSSYIDLEDNQNQRAFEQMQLSEQRIGEERKSQAKEIRTSLQDEQHEPKKKEADASKLGRRFLKEYPNLADRKQVLSKELIEFFAREYREENRPQTKRLLAELMGVLLEKYGYQQPSVDSQTVVDMEIDSFSTQGLNDHDERFPPAAELPSLSEENEDEQNLQQSSRDEFVQLLTKEACLTSNDENDQAPRAAAGRTVVLVSNKHENSLIIEARHSNHRQPMDASTVKRIKIDSPVSHAEIRSEDHHDFDERRAHSRSRSPSTSSPNASRSSSFARTDQRHFHSSRGRHQRYNYNHQSIASHARLPIQTSPLESNSNQYQYYQDNFPSLTYSQHPSLVDISQFMNFSNAKPSHTIERLQMYLNNSNSNRSWS